MPEELEQYEIICSLTKKEVFTECPYPESMGILRWAVHMSGNRLRDAAKGFKMNIAI